MSLLHRVSLCFVLSCGAAAAADSVGGQFVLDGKVFKPSQVAAFRVRDQFHPREFESYVMLTTAAVDRAAIAADDDPYAVAINDPAVKDADYLSLFVRANGEVSMNAHIGGTQYVDTSGTMMGQKGSLQAQCASNTRERVACTVKVAAPVKTHDGPSWSVDVNFDAAVAARAPGQAVAAGGGEMGQALMALYAAVQGNDLSRILALLSRAQGENYRREYNTPEENLQDAKSTLGFQLPKHPKITGGERLDADTVLLEVEGVPYENGRMLYLVRMRREDGHWGFDGARVAGMLK